LVVLRPRDCLLPCLHELEPVPLLAFAGVVALVPLAALVRRPTSALRLLVESFLTTGAVITVFWLAWVAYWLLEQRR
jgi:hypothetical protein